MGIGHSRVQCDAHIYWTFDKLCSVLHNNYMVPISSLATKQNSKNKFKDSKSIMDFFQK